MSKENVDIARRAWEAWGTGDVDALFELFDPAIEWTTTNFDGWPEDDLYQGEEAVRRFVEQWRASWERYEAGAYEYIDVDDERVLVLCWQRGFGSASRVPVEMDWAQLCTVRGGLVCRIEAYSDPRRAREAVGLGD